MKGGQSVLAILALVSAASPLLAQEPDPAKEKGFYAAVRGGLNWAPDETIKGGFESRDDRDTGWAAGGSFGYDFRPVRLELEYLFRQNDLDGLDVRQDGGAGQALGLAPLAGDVPVDSTNINASTIMVNALYDVPVLKGARPFLGGGLGLAVVDLDYRLTGGQTLLESDEAMFAVQGIVGLEYPIVEALAAEVSYHYLTTTENTVALAGGSRADARYKSHSLFFGLRYTFGGAPKRQRAAPAPTPAPPPANRAPIAGNDTARVRAGESVGIDALANDSDPDGSLSGIATIGEPAHGSVSRNADGTLRYTADPQFIGRDSFEYTIQDDAGAIATAEVSVHVIAPEIGPFLVFFDWDEAELRNDAAAILDDAAKAYRAYGLVRVMVAGHTDTSGPEAYNDRLSRQRAAAVREALVARGVPATNIVSGAYGENEPLVPTEDGVREPQNRRVEITFPQAGS